MQEKTILGVTLRRRIITTVNGMSRGAAIRVIFKGTRAYTNGKDIVLPAIKDLAEIPYSVARALMGYAIHEVAHILLTDFESIIRAIEAGKMEPDKLIKKFENAIEDYRIERDISKEFPGATSDLTALRNLIHPKLSKLKPEWLADPRACGPLALTWTGSRLNGFLIPDVAPTLDAMPTAVRALVENWTDRMEHVVDTDAVVDLAIVFTQEAIDFATASRNPQQQPSQGSQSSSDDDEQDQDPGATSSSSDNQPDDSDTKTDDKPSDGADKDPAADSGDDEAGADQNDSGEKADADQSPADAAGDPADAGEPNADGDEGQDVGDGNNADQGEPASDESEGAADGDQDQSQPTDGDQSGDQTGQSADGDDQDAQAESNPGPAGDAGAPSDQDNSAPSSDAGPNPGDATDGDGDAGDPNADQTSSNGDTTGPTSSADGKGSSNDGSGADDSANPNDARADDANDGEGAGGQPSDEDDGVDDLSFGSGAPNNPKSDRPGQPGTDKSGLIDMNNGLGDDPDPLAQPQPSNQDSSANSTSSPPSDEADPDADTSATEDNDDGAGSASASDGVQADDPAAGEVGDDEDDSNPLRDALDENAEFDDFLDDMREAIAEMGPLPEDAPEAEDGEVDPSQVLKDVAKANKAAPNYTSPDPDGEPNPDGENGPMASKNAYNDNRFVPVERAEDCQFGNLMAAASGVISTTARTIRRLLMSEERRGVLRGRRDGQFDIRNISAIVRQTGNCYKQKWERPAPETHLTILTDFSGSMDSDMTGKSKIPPITLAMTGALAIEEATRGTSITTSLYGYTGWSPEVILFTFKEGKQSKIATRQKIGAYADQNKQCTPTGEAMVAVGALLDQSVAKRRILLVLTDGTADDTDLCQGVVPVLERRGIEVVAIGINMDAVRLWCPNSHVINDVAQLPDALLKVIDPRAHKKPRRIAA